MNKKFLFTLLTIGVIVVGIAITYSVLRGSADHASTNVVGGDKDAHGCIGSAGYTWCEPKQKCLRPWEEYCGPSSLDETFNVLKSIRDADPGIYGYATSSSFEWRLTGNATTTVEGLFINANDAHNNDYDLARSYFKSNDFVTSNPNAADSPLGSQEGYQKTNLVCLLERRMTDFTLLPDKPVVINSDKQTIEVYCGRVQ